MTRVALTGLTAGELSPEMIGRADVQRYHLAARIVENFHIHPNGLIEYREGWMLLGSPKNQDIACRLQPFVFSDEQAYMLEFGNLYMRVWKDGGIIEASPGVPVEIATPWTTSDLQILEFTQSADVLWVFTGDDVEQPRKIKRTSHTTWTIEVWTPQDGPYFAENTNRSFTVTLSGTAGDVTVTANNYPAGQGPFKATDVGRHLRVLDRFVEETVKKTEWRWLVIIAFTDDTHVTANVRDQAFQTRPVDEVSWRVGVFSTTTGWPICGTIQEQRLWVAGSVGNPERVDGSRIGDYERFAPGPDAADAVAIGAATPRVNRIRHLIPLNDVMGMSVGAEIRVGSTSERAAITPDSVSAKPISNFGSARNVPCLAAGQGALFVDRNRRRVLEYAFSEEFNNYKATNLNVLAEHIAGRIEDGGFTGLAWQQQPIGLIWAPRGDGQIACATYAPNENVLAWVRHVLGGPPLPIAATSGAISGAICESIATLPGSVSEVSGVSPGDEVWGLFARYINGQWRRSIERLRITKSTETYAEERVHLDCALSFNNSINAKLTLSVNAIGPATGVCSQPIFVAGDVGRFIVCHWIKGWDDEDRPLMTYGVAQITAVNSTTAVDVEIIATFYDTELLALSWRLTVTQLTGLPAQLQNTPLMVVGDGRVDGFATSVGATLTLPLPASLVHIGFPYQGRLRTLPFDAGPVPAILQGRPSRIDRLMMRVINSTGGKVGTEKSRLETVLTYSVAHDAPMASPLARSEDIPLTPAGPWTGAPAYWVIQDMPLPLNIALQVPNVYSPAVQP